MKSTSPLGHFFVAVVFTLLFFASLHSHPVYAMLVGMIAFFAWFIILMALIYAATRWVEIHFERFRHGTRLASASTKYRKFGI